MEHVVYMLYDGMTCRVSSYKYPQVTRKHNHTKHTCAAVHVLAIPLPSAPRSLSRVVLLCLRRQQTCFSMAGHLMDVATQASADNSRWQLRSYERPQCDNREPAEPLTLKEFLDGACRPCTGG